MKVVLDESGFGMKVVLDEILWDEKRQVHPNLDETVPNLGSFPRFQQLPANKMCYSGMQLTTTPQRSPAAATLSTLVIVVGDVFHNHIPTVMLQSPHQQLSFGSGFDIFRVNSQVPAAVLLDGISNMSKALCHSSGFQAMLQQWPFSSFGSQINVFRNVCAQTKFLPWMASSGQT